jgi:hypothetical protein
MDIKDMLQKGRFGYSQNIYPGVHGFPCAINDMKTRPTIFGVRNYRTDRASLFRFTDNDRSVDCDFEEYEKGDLIIESELCLILYVSVNKRYLVDSRDGGGLTYRLSPERDGDFDEPTLPIRVCAASNSGLNLDSMSALVRVLVLSKILESTRVSQFRVELNAYVDDKETFGGILPDPCAKVCRAGWQATLVYMGECRCGVPFADGHLRFSLDTSMPPRLVGAREHKRNIIHTFTRCTPDMFLLDIDVEKPRMRRDFYCGYKPLASLKQSFFIAGETLLKTPEVPRLIEKSTERSLKWRGRLGICVRVDAFPDDSKTNSLNEGDYAAPLGETFKCATASHCDLILVPDERCRYYWSWPHYVLSAITPVFMECGLSSFVIVWIADWLPYMDRWPALEKLRTVEALMASYRRVRAK